MSNVYGATAFRTGIGGGEVGQSLEGTGYAVPAGIEAVLEYNELLMNVRKNADRYRVNSIDGLFDAEIRDAREVNTDWDGETPLSSYYGGRTLVINGTVDTYSVKKLRDMQQALRAAFVDITTEYALRFSVGDPNKDHIIYCKKIAPISGIEQQVNYKASRDFQITLRASNPRFLSYIEHNALFDPASYTASPVFMFNMPNFGNYWAEPRIRIYGPSTSITITSATTQQEFTISNVPADDYFEFDISGPSPTLVDSAGDNQWDHLADDSDYLVLAQANTNPIYYTGDAAYVKAYWRDSWM